MQTLQQIKDQYKKLPPKTRAALMAPEFSEKIDKICQKNNLDKEHRDIIAKSIFDFFVEINNRENIYSAIPQNNNRQRVFDEIENELLNNIDNIYNKIATEENYNDKNDTNEQKDIASTKNMGGPKTPNNIGADFEQIILNQARAMQPARESGQHLASSIQVPENLPTQPEEKAIHNYIGNDPYREPIE